MLDARGLSCPMPVVMVQKEVKKGNSDVIEVMVDAECSVENITRYANSQGFSVSVEQDGDESKIILKK